MRKFFLFAVTFMAVLSYSCRKSPFEADNKRKPMDEEIQFTSLTAEKNSLGTDESTKVKAAVENPCRKLTYDWSSSEGYLNGEGPEITFNAPPVKQTITLTCTVNHPGKNSRTRSILLTVE